MFLCASEERIGSAVAEEFDGIPMIHLLGRRNVEMIAGAELYADYFCQRNGATPVVFGHVCHCLTCRQ